MLETTSDLFTFVKDLRDNLIKANITLGLIYRDNGSITVLVKENALLNPYQHNNINGTFYKLTIDGKTYR